MDSTTPSKNWAGFARALENGSRSLERSVQARSLAEAIGLLLPKGTIHCGLEDEFGRSTTGTPLHPTKPGDAHLDISPRPGYRATVNWSGSATDHETARQRLEAARTRLGPVLAAWATLQAEALRDPLTGAGNRRALTDHLASQLALHRRHATPCCALMLDVDGFKAVNDTQGHAAGDRLLRELSDWLRGAVRAEDQLFRYGGDEFILVLAATDDTGAKLLRDRLTAPDAPLRVSIGLAAARPDDDPDALLARADSDLLRQRENPAS